jgi:hypothetical protein
MGLIVWFQLARFTRPLPWGVRRWSLGIGALLLFNVSNAIFGQEILRQESLARASELRSAASPRSHTMRARRFLGGRSVAGGGSEARAMDAARRQHSAMLAQQVSAEISSLSASWQPIGPNQIATPAFGDVTGRVTSIAMDPADTSGNTVYVGTTGGGVWKSSNAAGDPANVTFTPLTDTLPVFSANAGSSATASLSIGAVSVQSGVVLAGTGDPNDATDSYYGSGILRSSDGGLTWTLIQNSRDGGEGNHSFMGLGFAGFAWSGATAGMVVAAVSQAAEGVLVNAPDATNSVMGLYYSNDAGVTWQMATIMDGSSVVQRPQLAGGNLGGVAATAVVWNPVRQRFFAAIRYHGYYESADGMNWSRMTNQPGAGLTTAACPPPSPGVLGSAGCPIFRGVLAVQPVTGDTFALTVDSNNVDQGLWQDVCRLSGGSCSSNTVAFGTQLVSTAIETGNGSAVIPQADYDLSLAAVSSGTSGSTQDTLLYVGTVDLYRCSLAAGCVFRNTTNAVNGCNAPARVAPAQHAIAALATSALPLIYLGNDGGLWRSTNGVNQQSVPCSSDDANHFQDLNGGLGSLAEVVSFAQSPTDENTVLAGLGANGTAGTSSASTFSAWPQLATGEGGTVAIDQANPLLWYLSTGAGVSISQCSVGVDCTAADFSDMPTIGAAQVNEDDSLIDAPWLLDPALTSDVLVGTCRVWRGPASNGAAWTSSNAISDLFAGPQNASCAATNSVVRSLAAGGSSSTAAALQNAGSEVLYAGMAGVLDGGGSVGGHLFSTTSANTANSETIWNDLASSPVVNGQGFGFNSPGFDISSVAADSHDATGGTVYVTVMGFAGNGLNTGHLYRSTDAGAHWTNISSNLPNAPANSVVVDPNDANTVYVALDTGVYVTSQVTTCSSANCWSVYGTNLPNAPIVELAAAPRMPTGDGRTGELRAGTYGRGVWQIPLLTAYTSIQPAISLSPESLNFATQAVGTASLPQTITVTNSGTAPMIVSTIVASGDFNEIDTCTSSSIAINASCTIQVSFLPTMTGSRIGTLTIYANVPGGQEVAALSGSGSAGAAIVLDPPTLAFPTTTVNSTSPSQNITISNTSGNLITLQTPSVAGGDFRITADTCGASLGPDTGCTVSVTFVPGNSGLRTGTFTITDGAGTQTAYLSGMGTLPATDTISPHTLSFAPQQLGTASSSQEITLTNAGDIALTLISAQILSGDFTAVNQCGNSLNAHSSCSIDVAFEPKNVGTIAGLLAVTDEYGTQSVTLSGSGVAPQEGVSLSPLSTIAFPATGVGVSSAAQTVTLTNNGGVPLIIQGVSLTGDFATVPGGNSCGSSVAVGSACTVQIVFAPTAGGPRAGSFAVTDNAGSSPQTLSLTGTGVDFGFNPDGVTSLTITNGQNAVYPLLLSSASNIPGTATFTCTGVPANATCNVTPSSAALGTTTVVSVTVLTGVSSAGSTQRASKGTYGVWLAAMLPISLLAFRRVKISSSLAVLSLCCWVMTVSGCGAGRAIPSSDGSNPSGSGPATPSGTYSIVASATSGGLTRTVTLTLVVQ